MQSSICPPQNTPPQPQHDQTMYTHPRELCHPLSTHQDTPCWTCHCSSQSIPLTDIVIPVLLPQYTHPLSSHLNTNYHPLCTHLNIPQYPQSTDLNTTLNRLLEQLPKGKIFVKACPLNPLTLSS